MLFRSFKVSRGYARPMELDAGEIRSESTAEQRCIRTAHTVKAETILGIISDSHVLHPGDDWDVFRVINRLTNAESQRPRFDQWNFVVREKRLASPQ